MLVHRPALEYDFRRLGFTVRDVLARTVSLREASGLAMELLRDPDSHTFASAAGWSFVPGAQARATVDLFEAWVNAKRAKGKIPYHATRPWLTDDGGSPGPVLAPSADDLAQRARLDQALGLAGPSDPPPTQESE